MKAEFQKIDDLIIAFLADNLSDQERRRLYEWIHRSADNMKYFQDYQKLWFSSMNENSLKRFDDKKAYESFLKRVENAESGTKPVSIRHFKHVSVLKYAAAILAACMISYVSYNKGERDLQNALAQITVESSAGAQTRLYLPDSTLVVLNSKSVLSYSQKFGLKDRTIQLSGEGYFKVAHNEQKPFVIHGKDVSVTVLGTEFNFKDYPTRDVIKVSLFQGKVRLDNKLMEQEMTLLPNEQMVMNRTKGSMEKMTSIPQFETCWMNGKIVFKNSSLREIIEQLECVYGVKIRVANDKMYHYCFNGAFIISETTAEGVLTALRTTGRLNFRKDNKGIIIY